MAGNPAHLGAYDTLCQTLRPAAAARAGDDWSSEPIVGLLNQRMLAKIFYTTELRLQIEVPEPAWRLLAVPIDYRWVPAGEVTITAGTMTLHPYRIPAGRFPPHAARRRAGCAGQRVCGRLVAPYGTIIA